MNHSQSNTSKQQQFVKVPDEKFFAALENGFATPQQAQIYYTAVHNFLFKTPNSNQQRGYSIALAHYYELERMFEEWGYDLSLIGEEEIDDSTAPPSESQLTSINPASATNSGKFIRRQPKTLDELKSELISAATSSNPKLALTQIAALNGIAFEAAESLAIALLKDEGLTQQHDLEKRDYQKCIEQMRELELLLDPGEKAWKMQELARRYKRSESQLRETYNHSLIVVHCSEPMSLEELDAKFGGEQRWLLRGWLPSASLTAFYAPGGTGKTLFTQHLIKCLLLGENWGQYKVTKPHKILYIQTDTSPGLVRESLKQAGILSNPNLKIHTDWSIEYIPQLYKWVKDFEIEFVVIDSISSVSRNSVIHENDMAYAKPILQMGDIRRELGCSFFLIHHANSAGEMRGSKALKASVDEVWKLENPSKGDVANINRTLTIEKSRSRMPMKYLLEFNDYDYSWQNLGFADIKEEDKSDNRTKTAILRIMEQNPGIRHCSESLSEELNISINTIRKELPNLWREGLISRELNPNYKNGGSEPKHFYKL